MWGRFKDTFQDNVVNKVSKAHGNAVSRVSQAKENAACRVQQAKQQASSRLTDRVAQVNHNIGRVRDYVSDKMETVRSRQQKPSGSGDDETADDGGQIINGNAFDSCGINGLLAIYLIDYLKWFS